MTSTENEVLHLHVGSAAINVGYHTWQLYALEHRLNTVEQEKILPRCFFTEWNEDDRRVARPRALFIDRDSNALNAIQTSEMKDFFHEDQFLSVDQSAELVSNTIRKQVEMCDRFQGFIFSHSTNGNCSDLSSEILIDLKTEYSKKIVLTNSIFGSSINISNMSNLFEYADVVLPMENKALFNICQHRLNIQTPTYFNVNRLIATCWSDITSSMRFDGCLLSNLNEFSSHLVPFPSLKLISTYLSPLIPYPAGENLDCKSPSVYDMCLPSLIEPNSGSIDQISEYKMAVSLCLLFRGENIIPKEIGQKLICDLKKSIRFSSRSPTGFRCGINYQRPCIFNDQSDLMSTDKQVLMLTNETTTSKYLCQQALNQYEQSSEKEKDLEGYKHIVELMMNYEQIEKEIYDDFQSHSEE